MEAIFVLVPVSLVIIFTALMVFVWSVNNGQYDDLEMESTRILHEETHDEPQADPFDTTLDEGRDRPKQTP